MGNEMRKPGMFRGAAVDLSRRYRWLVFGLLLLLTAGLCYSQFGIMAFGNDLTGDLNFVLFLIPVALCVVMLGVVPGVALAFIAGVLIMMRSQWTPTTLYDFQMADPFLSVVSITIGAILMSVIVTPAARRWPVDLASGVSTLRRISPARIMSLVVGCFVFAFVFSYGTRGLLYLIVTPGGAEYDYASMVAGYLASLTGPLVFVEALINGVILSAACVVTVAFDANRRSGTWRIGLNESFTRWLAFGMLVVFVLASSVSFCVETMRATNDAEVQMRVDLEYLRQQVATYEPGASVEPVAVGYFPLFGGNVMVIRDHAVVSSNNPKYVGVPASKVLSSGNEDNFDFLAQKATEGMLKGTDDDWGGFAGLCALIDGDYTYIAVVPMAQVFQARTATLMYNAGFLLVMLIVVFVIVNRLLARVVIGPIRRTNYTLGKITEGELSRRVEERSVNEFDELSTGINTTVTSMRDMMGEIAQRNAQDLTAAKAIQESALPREFPPFPDVDRFDIYASMKTAKEVGGDFYDFFLIDGEQLAFLVADVSGKGIPAALFMMTAKTQLRNYLEAGLPVDEALDAANHQLCLGNDAGMFVTAWVGVLEYQTGQLEFVNAGHNPPLLCHEGEWTWVRDVSGMPLGLFDGIPYDKYTCQLAAEDALYLYTDGVTEAISADCSFFGDDRLIETLERFTGMNARSVSVGVRRAITDFTKDAEQSDDITMVSLRYGVPPEKRAIMVLPADVSQLIHVQNFIHEELRRRGAPKAVYSPLDIAAEELFVNVCHYAYPDDTPEDRGEVRIEFEYEASPPSLTVSISDDGVPYDPLAYPEAVTPDDIEAVPIGGLGILMARRSVDDMVYERAGESNVVTFRKGW